MNREKSTNRGYSQANVQNDQRGQIYQHDCLQAVEPDVVERSHHQQGWGADLVLNPDYLRHTVRQNLRLRLQILIGSITNSTKISSIVSFPNTKQISHLIFQPSEMKVYLWGQFWQLRVSAIQPAAFNFRVDALTLWC
jgi:hypothetical protein